MNGEQDAIGSTTTLDAHSLLLSDTTEQYIRCDGSTTRKNGLGIQFGNQLGYERNSGQISNSLYTTDTLEIVGV